MKVECLKSNFCAFKGGKNWKKEELRKKEPVLELREMDSKQVMFFNEIASCYFYFSISIFKWLLALTMLH